MRLDLGRHFNRPAALSTLANAPLASPARRVFHRGWSPQHLLDRRHHLADGAPFPVPRSMIVLGANTALRDIIEPLDGNDTGQRQVPDVDVVVS